MRIISVVRVTPPTRLQNEQEGARAALCGVHVLNERGRFRALVPGRTVGRGITRRGLRLGKGAVGASNYDGRGRGFHICYLVCAFSQTTASIWTNPQCCPRLPLVVSMATLPEATASQPQSPLLSFRPGPGGTVVSDLMDPLLSGGTSCDSFRESDWSPVGCSHMGG